MSEKNKEIRQFTSGVVASANLAKADLEKKSYDRDAIWRFAKAAKSWCERETEEFLMWECVIQMTAPSEAK